MEKIALVTGGASGIGLAITEKFIQNGIRTIIIGRDEKKLAAAQQRLGSLCEAVRFDLNETRAIPSLTDQLFQQFGKIDILVNNAGVNLKKNFTDVTIDEFEHLLSTNVTSVFVLSREIVKHMLANEIKGSIINISSMAAQYGIPKVIAYTAAKSAIEGMTRAMAVELSPRGIRINCIAPGFIAT